MTRTNHIREIEAEAAQEEPYDTSDPQQVNTARKKSARTRADRMEFVAAAMTTPQGRAWFYDIIEFCHCFKTSFSGDPYVTAFNSGEQNIGLRILDDIQMAAPEFYLTMITENKKK